MKAYPIWCKTNTKELMPYKVFDGTNVAHHIRCALHAFFFTVQSLGSLPYLWAVLIITNIVENYEFVDLLEATQFQLEQLFSK